MVEIDGPIDEDRSFAKQIKKVASVSPFKIKIYSDATYTYLCKARAGAVLATANWQISRWDSTGSSETADQYLKYGNLATDLTTVQGLSYN